MATHAHDRDRLVARGQAEVAAVVRQVEIAPLLANEIFPGDGHLAPSAADDQLLFRSLAGEVVMSRRGNLHDLEEGQFAPVWRQTAATTEDRQRAPPKSTHPYPADEGEISSQGAAVRGDKSR